MGKKTKKEDSDISSDESEVEDTVDDETDSDEQSEEDKNLPNTDTLKEKVTGYIKIDDLIRAKKDEIKELTEKKLKYEEFIKKYLEKANKTKIATNDGDIVFKKQTSRAPLKETFIETAITKKFQDADKITDSGVKSAHDIIAEINTMRGVSITNNIRRMKKKK